MALALINKVDSFEMVRDQIAGILVTELANQQALAPGEGQDPLDYTLSVYVERDMPVEQWADAGTVINAATAPIVSVWVDSSTRNDGATATTSGTQIFDVTYNLDVTARGVSSNVVAGGYLPADEDARKRCHAATRLVRNILSALPNRQLLLPAIVWAFPTFENLEFGPAPLDDAEPNISAWNCRMRFRVTMTELSPELAITETLDLIRIDVSDHGGVILSTEIP